MTENVAIQLAGLRHDAIIELFVLDATSVGGGVHRFHAGTNGLRQPLYWQGQQYEPFPIQAEGFSRNSQGSSPRPTLTVSNVLGLVGVLAIENKGLRGAKVTRKRTLRKYLDSENFQIRRNWLTYTQDFDSATWVKAASSVSANQTLAPDGSSSADLLVESATNAQHIVRRDLPASASTTYTITQHFKRSAASRNAFIRVANNGSNAFGASYASFDLGSGMAGAPIEITAGLGPVSSAIQSLGSGWYRCSLTVTTAANTSSMGVVFGAFNGAISYLGDGSSGLYMWGAQFEAGPAATIYQSIGATFAANPSADPDAGYVDEVWLIDRISRRDKYVVQFELASPMDVAGLKLPRRQVLADTCTLEYRGPECGYAGGPVAKADDTPTSDPALDDCSHCLRGCRLRTWPNGELPFGGFPGAGAVRRA